LDFLVDLELYRSGKVRNQFVERRHSEMSGLLTSQFTVVDHEGDRLLSEDVPGLA
jgi:hypothetical protein